VHSASKRTSKTEGFAILAVVNMLLALAYLMGGSHHGAWYVGSRSYGFVFLLIAFVWAARAWRAFRNRYRRTQT